jgi:GNAT superfamily N-acetyltransferase/predicted enzyme related to lactoylglutathione lyase
MSQGFAMIVKIASPEEKSRICENILRKLPNWFGIESAIVDYCLEVASLDTWCYFHESEPIGFISIKKYSSYSVEIHVMGVIESSHHKGIGRALVREAELDLIQQKFKYLSVKTLSETHPDLHYAKTRIFYLAIGFNPVQEFKTLWGEHNSCLLMIKDLTVQTNNPIKAVMIHAANSQKAFEWYQLAFPEARSTALPEHDFHYLDYRGVHLEIVVSDSKVGSGPYGSVVYWDFPNFEIAKKHFETIGATLYRGPMQIEEGQAMCQVQDPFGNLIGIRAKK